MGQREIKKIKKGKELGWGVQAISEKGIRNGAPNGKNGVR